MLTPMSGSLEVTGTEVVINYNLPHGLPSCADSRSAIRRRLCAPGAARRHCLARAAPHRQQHSNRRHARTRVWRRPHSGSGLPRQQLDQESEGAAHSNVAVLDGGWVKWAAKQRATSATAAAFPAATFKVKPGTVKVATADQVKAAINNPTMKLIDARTQAEIDGKDLRNIKRGGFIESSIPVYWEDTLDATTKAFKPAAEIAKLYRDKGITSKDEVTVYCQVGMRAAHDLFTLALIGHDLTKLSNYYGAWEEWGNREDTPIKTKQ